MKHFYLKSLMMALMLFVGVSAWADTATFDFTSTSTATALGVTPSTTKSTGVTINNKSITVNTISCAFSKNSGNDAVFFTKSDASSYQVRIYVNDVITLSAPTGFAISAITINGSNLTKDTYMTASTGTYGGTATAATWTGESQSVVLTCAKSTPQINSITVTFSAAASVAAPTFSVAAGTYASTQSVELSCTTEGATIYYTTNGDAPTNSSTQYSSAISVSSTTTIKAIAYKDGAASNVAEATYNFLTPYTTLAAAHTAAEATGTTKVDCAFTFTDVLVTGVTSNNAYIVDGNGDAAVIYASGHGFAVGDKINGTAIGQMQIYQTYALELVDFKKTSAGLTVTSGNTVTPVTKTLAEITTADMCKLLKVTDVKVTTATYTANTTKLTDGTNEILFYNTFGAIGSMNFSTEANYTITGIIPAYSTLEFAPRTAEDVVCNLIAPSVSFANASVQVAYNENTVAANVLTNNGGAATYTSSNTAVATVNATTGEVTLVAPGVTTITATTAENATYLPGSASYKVVYLSGDGSEEHPFNAVDLNNATGVSGNVWVSGKILGSSANAGTGVASSYAATNIALGNDQANPSLQNTITVAIYDSPLRNVLDLTKDASVIGKTIKVYGQYNSNYYKRCGINGNASQKIAGLAADLTVSSVGYATYYDAAAWIVPVGLTVKYVSAANAGTLTWGEYAEGATVPANTGVVVSGAAANYPIVYIGSKADAPTNLLSGTVTATAIPAEENYYYYGLSLNAAGETNSVGFYWMAADGAAFTNGAHKAYLKLAKGGGSVKGYAFNDSDADAISALHTSSVKNGTFGNGRNVFIENGKIVIVKNGVKYNAAGLQIR